jgi:hypothetical protein
VSEAVPCLVRVNPEPTTLERLAAHLSRESEPFLAHGQIIAKKFQVGLSRLQECNKICSVVGGLFQLEDLISRLNLRN